MPWNTSPVLSARNSGTDRSPCYTRMPFWKHHNRDSTIRSWDLSYILQHWQTDEKCHHSASCHRIWSHTPCRKAVPCTCRPAIPGWDRSSCARSCLPRCGAGSPPGCRSGRSPCGIFPCHLRHTMRTGSCPH